MTNTMERSMLAASVMLAMVTQANARQSDLQPIHTNTFKIESFDFVDYQSHSYSKLSPQDAKLFGYGVHEYKSVKLDSSYDYGVEAENISLALESDVLAQVTGNAKLLAVGDTSAVLSSADFNSPSLGYADAVGPRGEKEIDSDLIISDTDVLSQGLAQNVDIIYNPSISHAQGDEPNKQAKVILVAQDNQTQAIEATSVVPADLAAASAETVADEAVVTGGVNLDEDIATEVVTEQPVAAEATGVDTQDDAQMINAQTPASEQLAVANPVAQAIEVQQAEQANETGLSGSQQAEPAVATDMPEDAPAAEVESTPSMVPKPKAEPKTADEALAAQEGDASSEKNLEEVFTASEKRYSLLKQGKWGLNYDADYSYYRDSVIDIATRENSSDIIRFRVEEESQHGITNSFNVQYGILDNLTLSATIPVVAKSSLIKDTTAVDLGDINLGARWEPFPLEKDRLPLIFNGNVSLPTGVSPYEINRDTDIATGKGYYSFGGGVSTRKYVDPVVLFASGSLSYGLEQDDLDQNIGSRRLVGVKPNLGGGVALGFAYSLNYDVSLTMSYQQSFSAGSEFTVRQTNPETGDLEEFSYTSADQTSATMNMALGVRTSPKTIVNTSVGFGLTEDAPDASIGVSFPLDFAGLGNR